MCVKLHEFLLFCVIENNYFFLITTAEKQTGIIRPSDELTIIPEKKIKSQEIKRLKKPILWVQNEMVSNRFHETVQENNF